MMKNEMIKLNASEVENLKTPIEIALGVDDDGSTTARKLYGWLDLEDTHYARWIKNNILDNPFAELGNDYSPLMASENKGRGNYAQDYKLSASFAKKLAMSQRSERGEQARTYFLKVEKALVAVAAERQKALIVRERGKAVRKSLTDAIIQSGENERMKGYGISCYTNLIYKTALGYESGQYRKTHGLGKKANIRDHLTAAELSAVIQVEERVRELLESDLKYDDIKECLANEFSFALRIGA